MAVVASTLLHDHNLFTGGLRQNGAEQFVDGSKHCRGSVHVAHFQLCRVRELEHLGDLHHELAVLGHVSHQHAFAEQVEPESLALTDLHVERHKRNNFVNDVLACGAPQTQQFCQ